MEPLTAKIAVLGLLNYFHIFFCRHDRKLLSFVLGAATPVQKVYHWRDMKDKKMQIRLFICGRKRRTGGVRKMLKAV